MSRGKALENGQGQGLDYEEEALDCLRLLYGASGYVDTGELLAEAQVWATLHLARMTSGQVS